MTARNLDEDRAASPLELLFDLTFVIAVAQIASQLAHAIEEGHAAEAVPAYLIVFFAIWWAWMNFTWFASGYDNEDTRYRILTMVQMAGVLVLAAGIPAAINDSDYRAMTFGYFAMRIGLIAQWLRVARDDENHRHIALRNAIGFGAVQVGWLLRLLLPPEWNLPTFVVLAILDMSVPLWASRAGDPSWNAKHIAERYALFTIILLGEGVLAAFSGVSSALMANGLTVPFVLVALSALVIVFSFWWLYYLQPAEEGLRRRREYSYVWGYAHYLIFAALAALGAGLEVAVISTGNHLEVSDLLVAYAVAVPVALCLFVLWGVYMQLVSILAIRARVMLPGVAAALLAPLAVPFIGLSGVLLSVAVICAVVVGFATLDQKRLGIATPPSAPIE